MELKDLLENLQKIHNKLGLWGVILFITLILLSSAIVVYLKYSIKSSAEEFSKKTIADFKNYLNKSLQTQMGLFFRDETIRNSLIVSIGQISFNKKIECWQLTQNLYFNYQKSWNFTENTEVKKYIELDNNLNELRIKIFNETIYIGYDLSEKLVRLNSLMREGLRNRRTEFAYSGKNYQLYAENKLQSNLNKQKDVESEISDLLYNVEKWIMKKLYSDQTIDKFEFTPEQLEKIKSERNKQFDEFNQ